VEACLSRGTFASFVSKTRDWIVFGGGLAFRRLLSSDFSPFFAWLRVVCVFGRLLLRYPTKIPG